MSPTDQSTPFKDGESASNTKNTETDAQRVSVPTIIPAKREIWTQMFPESRKMMAGSITATSPLPTAGATKLTYETHPHIVEHLLDYAATNTLLAFRATCRKLRDRADKVFGSHIELHMDGLSLVFETPGARVIKGQRIPSFYRASRRNIRLDVRPTLEQIRSLKEDRFDHRIVNFAVHHTDAEWFTRFLSNIKILDFHGGIVMTILGLPPRNGPDALGEVAVKSVKVPVLRFHSDGGESCQFATAVPFHADVVEYIPALNLPTMNIKGSWLFYPPWVPDCQKVVHHLVLRIDQKFDVSLDKVRPFVYPATVKLVDVRLAITKAPVPGKFVLPTTTAEERRIPMVTLLTTIQRICGAFQSSIVWLFSGFDDTKVTCPDGDIPPSRVPELVMLYLVRLQAAIQKITLETDADFKRVADEIRDRVIFSPSGTLV